MNVTDPKTGKTLTITPIDGSDPTEQELEQLFIDYNSQPDNPIQPISYPGVNRGIQAGQAIGKAYSQVRKGVQDFAGSLVPESAAPIPSFFPNPISPLTPIKTANSPRESAIELAGMGTDELATLGLVGGTKLAGKTAISIEKLLTSILRRVAGQSSSDIKLGRQLMAEGGVGAVMSKTKAKPEYLGREIAPKAADIASKRVKEMNPNALREIKVSPEGNQLAQDLKAKFGLKEFPTKSSADEFYSGVINNAPDDIQIPLDDLEAALSDPNNKLGNREMQVLKSFVNRTRLDETGQLQKVPLSKDEYNNIRGMLNNIDPTGETPAVQAIKQALDTDFGKVVPEIAEAKGRFQLSRETPKVESFLNKATAEEDMARRLSSSEAPENVQVRESLSRLLGPEGENLVKETQAQRLAKQWYSNQASGRSMNPRANPFLEFFKEIAKPVPRGYEKLRAGAKNLWSGLKPPPIGQEVPVFTSSAKPYTPPIANVKETSNVGEILRNVLSREPESISPISEEAILAAQERMAKEAVARGEIPYISQGVGQVKPMGYGLYNKVPIRPEEVPTSSYGIPQDLPEPTGVNPYSQNPFNPGQKAPVQYGPPIQGTPYGEALPYKPPTISSLLKKRKGKK